jgi:hypothetical protein
LLPVAVEAIAFLTDVLGRLEAQLQRGGFQGALDRAGHEVIDRRRPQAVTGRSRAHLQVSFARIIRGGLARIGGVHPVAARAADNQARQHRHAPARRARRAAERAVLLETSEVRQGSLPADVRREVVLQEHLPLRDRQPPLPSTVSARSLRFRLVPATSVGIGPGAGRVVQHLVERRRHGAPPGQPAARGSAPEAHPQSDVVSDQVMKHPINRTEFIELVEDQAHDVAGLLVRVAGQLAGRQLDVPAGGLGEQLAALGLGGPASTRSISHSNKFEFADCALQAGQEPVVGVIGVGDAILIGQERAEEGADLQEVVPIPGRPGEAAQLRPQDQPDVVHRDLGEPPLEAVPPVGPLGASALVVVDDQDPIGGPPQGQGLVDQLVLSLARLLVVEHLLRAGLTDGDDRQAVQVPVSDRGRSPTTGGRCRTVRDTHGRVRARPTPPPFRPEAPPVDEPRRG